MKKYLDIMRIDLMTMNGEKNSMLTLFILVFVGSIAGELFLSPMFGFIGMIMVGGMTVPIVFTSHLKYGSEKIFGLLPVLRKDLVKARFIMFVTLYLAMALVMYVFMEVSLALKISAEITGDFEQLLADSGINIGYGSLCRLLFFVFFAFGMLAVVSSLKGYFSDPEAYEALAGVGMKVIKTKPKQLVAPILIIAASLVFFMFAFGVIPFSAGFAVILQLLIQLFTAAYGILFSLVMITLAAFTAIYHYFCTVLEYEDKDI